MMIPVTATGAVLTRNTTTTILITVMRIAAVSRMIADASRRGYGETSSFFLY